MLPVLMAQTGDDMDRLARLLERNGQSALAADLRSRISSSSGGASGGGRVSKGGLAAGTAPNRIGADRKCAPVEEVDAGDLYKVYDPVGLQKRWPIHEVARVVVTALPDLHLPWKKGTLSTSLESLSRRSNLQGRHQRQHGASGRCRRGCWKLCFRWFG